jgi:hypothetical protein
VPLKIDHVIYAVADLESAARRLATELGLASLPGGRHEGHGTANRIVPLGDSYLELMSVADEAEACSSPMGSWILEQIARTDGLVGWCVAADDIEAVAARLDLSSVAMSRRRPDGTLLRWRLAGLDAAIEEPALPFFIKWNIDPRDHPGRSHADHSRRVTGISAIDVAGEQHRIEKWLGDHHLPIRLVRGSAGVKAVEIAGEDPLRLT